MISPRVDKPARERRLQLRHRDRRRQARAPDQLVLPQPRRGDLRRVPAADGRDRLEELPDDRARGSRGRQDQVPVPRTDPTTAPWRASCSASAGGIAAYKALELTRLATRPAMRVRVVQTPASTRFVGAASFAGITGAPVLVTRVGARPDARRLPRRPAARRTTRSAHLELVEQRRRRSLVAPATRQHDRQARRTGWPTTCSRRAALAAGARSSSRRR